MALGTGRCTRSSVRVIVQATACSVMVLAALVSFEMAGVVSPANAQVKAPAKAKLKPPVKAAAPSDPTDNVDRAGFDVGSLGSPNTMLVAQVGNVGAPASHIFRTLAAQTGVPAFTDMTAAESPAGQSPSRG